MIRSGCTTSRSKTESLIHISSTKRPEIVLFGDEATLTAPFALRAGEFCVTATEDDADPLPGDVGAAARRRPIAGRVSVEGRGLAAAAGQDGRDVSGGHRTAPAGGPV